MDNANDNIDWIYLKCFKAKWEMNSEKSDSLLPILQAMKIPKFFLKDADNMTLSERLELVGEDEDELLITKVDSLLGNTTTQIKLNVPFHKIFDSRKREFDAKLTFNMDLDYPFKLERTLLKTLNKTTDERKLLSFNEFEQVITFVSSSTGEIVKAKRYWTRSTEDKPIDSDMVKLFQQSIDNKGSRKARTYSYYTNYIIYGLIIIFGIYIQQNYQASKDAKQKLYQEQVEKFHNQQLAYKATKDFSYKNIKQMKWDTAYIQNIVKNRKYPVVFNKKDTPINTLWKKTKNWCNKDYLSLKAPVINKVKENKRNDKLFIYEEPTRLFSAKEFLTLDSDSYNLLDNVEMSDYLDGLITKNPTYISYYINNSPYNDYQMLFQDLLPSNNILAINDTEKEAYQTIWMANQKDVTAGFHYDPSHNFFTQICGVKRFQILPPNAITNLHLFPFYHSRYRQSQLEKESDKEHLEKYLEFYKDDLIEVDLGPGDVLYLPPYFYHRVISMPTENNYALSINTWSESLEQTIDEKLMKFNLPLKMGHYVNKKDEVVPTALAEFLRTLVNEVYRLITKKNDEDFAQQFFDDLIHERYLYSPYIKSQMKCAQKDQTKEVHTESEDVFTLKSCPKEVIVVDFVDDLILDAKLLAKQFVKLPGTDAKYKLAIATIMLNDFSEKATTYILGDLSFCVFLRCLANKNSFTTSSQKIEV